MCFGSYLGCWINTLSPNTGMNIDAFYSYPEAIFLTDNWYLSNINETSVVYCINDGVYCIIIQYVYAI